MAEDKQTPAKPASGETATNAPFSIGNAAPAPAAPAQKATPALKKAVLKTPTVRTTFVSSDLAPGHPDPSALMPGSSVITDPAHQVVVEEPDMSDPRVRARLYAEREARFADALPVDDKQ